MMMMHFAETWRSTSMVSLLLLGMTAVDCASAAELPPVSLSDYWTVISVSGRVYELPGANAWNVSRDIVPGDLLGPYQGIATGSDGEVTVQRGADAFTIYANTTVRLPPPSAGGAETRIDQADGEVLYVIEPSVGPSFEVTTPYVIAGIRGTSFAITDLGRRVIITEGRLLLTTADSGVRTDLLAGFEAVIGDPAASAVSVTALAADVMNLWAQRAATLADTVTSILQEHGQGVPGMPGGDGAGALPELLNGPGEAVGETVGDALGGARDAVSGVGGAVGETIGGAGEAVSGVGGAVGGIVKSAKDSLPIGH